jgi:hypothetical protein
VPVSPLADSRTRAERLASLGDQRQLRELYKSLPVTAHPSQGTASPPEPAGGAGGDEDGIDLDAAVSGHDLRAYGQGLSSGVKSWAADHVRDALALEVGRLVERVLDAQLAALREEVGARLRQLGADVEHRLGEALRSFESHADRLAGVLQEVVRESPVPVVQVPHDALHVQVEQAPVEVRVEQPAIQVQLPTRKVVKSIKYGPTGRPEAVEEVESDVNP